MGRNYEHLSREELISLLLARDRRDETKFGLVWEANEIERDKALNSDFIALDLDPALSVGEAPWRNLIIEGDNFDALRHLKMTFSGRIKCIYIDPPYNTGNKDFVYNDHFVEKEDLWRHSTWCEFIFQRLSLARDLLTEDGVIFVSIDDNEMPSLRLLLNKVFGEGKHVATCVWQKRYSRENREAIGDVHEYITVYAIDPEIFKTTRNRIPLDEAQAKIYRNPDNPKETDPAKRWRGLPMTAQGWRPNQMYEITAPNGKKHNPPEGRCWSMLESEYLKLRVANRIYWGKDGNAQPSVIRFLSEVEGLVPWTWWTHEEVGHTDEARKEIQSIFGTQSAFDTPKPVRLMERILQIATNPGDIVLDFFAGSGTTGHAVLKKNLEDGGDRRFILVSSTEATLDSPEKNLCRDICAERIRRVIEGQTTVKGAEVEGLSGNFAYLRCRKIAPSHLLEIEHKQVWTALQLIHRPNLMPYKEAPFLVAEGGDDATLIYVPRFHKKILPKLRETVMRHAAVVIYSWQPGLLLQHLRADHVQHEAIPESLARRFGLKS